MAPSCDPTIHDLLHRGLLIPASPLAMDARRQWDQRWQLGLWRYYAAAGAGGTAGIHEVLLLRQGLLEGIWCLDPNETLSPGQSEEIDRVYRMCPHLNDDEFVAEHRDEWLK